MFSSKKGKFVSFHPGTSGKLSLAANTPRNQKYDTSGEYSYTLCSSARSSQNVENMTPDYKANSLKDLLDSIVLPFDQLNGPTSTSQPTASSSAEVIEEHGDKLYAPTWTLNNLSRSTTYRVSIRPIRRRNIASQRAIHNFFKSPLELPTNYTPCTPCEIYYILDATLIPSFVMAAGRVTSKDHRAPWDDPESVFTWAYRHRMEQDWVTEVGQIKAFGFSDVGVDHSGGGKGQYKEVERR
ncbi:hypothetical protein K469DRAFT_703412 [Zopfia rhizophila CBS 207.26]|uniref:Uncharacterized protein n=1 Tax=Zopfia rhizophila CBS 207.26 TaxID=1314779 RepID=A0A6A6D6I7_9PEZI|nr:hypothetical protein K469DRAFT_703412 [Zopfia rhizophila CBS 207.26]